MMMTMMKMMMAVVVVVVLMVIMTIIKSTKVLICLINNEKFLYDAKSNYKSEFSLI
jgi:uncharacterized membrane protein YqiK